MLTDLAAWQEEEERLRLSEPINADPWPYLMQQAGPAVATWNEAEQLWDVEIPMRVIDARTSITSSPAPSPPPRPKD